MKGNPVISRAEIRNNDSDPFLRRFIPGSDAYHSRLRAEITRLNSDRALQLVRFVLIVGPTGSGKNYIARVCAAHRYWIQSQRSEEVVVPKRMDSLNDYLDKFGERMMSEIPHDLAESALFGHKKGAFTGAVDDREGLFGESELSDLMLDEIGDADLRVQAKLLAVLERRPFIPVGGNKRDSKTSEHRVFLCTNADLARLVQEQRFRSDLYFRIKGHTIVTSGLSSHPEAIPSIAESLIRNIWIDEMREGEDLVPSISEEDRTWLRRQKWEGNARELADHIRQWLLEGGQAGTLSTTSTMQEYTPYLASDDGGTINTAIEEILADRRPAPGSVKKFLADRVRVFARRAEIDFLRWYDQTKPDTNTLKKLFPEMKITSVRSDISRMRSAQ